MALTRLAVCWWIAAAASAATIAEDVAGPIAHAVDVDDDGDVDVITVCSAAAGLRAREAGPGRAPS